LSVESDFYLECATTCHHAHFLNLGEKMNRSIKPMAKHRVGLLLLIVLLVVGGFSAQAAGILNSDTGGYLVCVNSKTKVITHPGTSKCPKGSKSLVFGKQGPIGLTGASGLSGKDGRDGLDGKTLWNGIKDPENSWGSPGDMFINSVTKTLFGPKNLDGTWPVGVSMVGPQGERGPIGPTGFTGATGAQGPSGPAGAQGPAGSNASLTCAQGGTCTIGDTGPGGGIVFHVQTPTSTAPWRYLEAAPMNWNDGNDDPRAIFCNLHTSDYSYILKNLRTGSRSTTSTSKIIGKGFLNTKTILNECTYGAASVAGSYNGGGKVDWFLPSKDELNQMYLKKALIGGIKTDGHYWSSSEEPLAPESAIVQEFVTGTGYNDFWGNSNYVRPIRAF
jgi:hypothetical protein